MSRQPKIKGPRAQGSRVRENVCVMPPFSSFSLTPLNPGLLEPFFRRFPMASWKCSNCGYTFEADAYPNQCPSCKEKCEFVDNTCYTPDCAADRIDPRIGGK